MATRNAINSAKPVQIAKGGTSTNTFVNSGVAYYDGTELNSTLAGTAQQALTSNGPSAAPSFQTYSGGSSGNWALIQSFALTGTTATVNFTSLGTYQTVALVYSQIYYTSGTASNVGLTFSTNGGTSWVTTGYISGLWYLTNAATAWTNLNTTSYIRTTTGLGSSASSGSASGIVMIYGMNTASGMPSVQGDNYLTTTVYEKSAGWLNTAGNYNAVQVSLPGASGANFTGLMSLYGVVQ